MESKAAVSSSQGIIYRFQWSYQGLAHDEAAMDLTSVICKVQVQTLATPMVARIQEVACSTSGSSVSPSVVGCFSIFPTYDAMTQVLDHPSQT